MSGLTNFYNKLKDSYLSDEWHHECRRALIVTIFIVLSSAILCSPVLAHSAAEMGIAPDQYDMGIPVYWPYHAVLMSTGFVLFLSGFIVMRFRKKPGKVKIHKLLQTAGGVSALSGLSVGIFMVALSGAPHIRYTHDMLGAGIVLLMIITLLLGYFINRATGFNPGVHKSHRWIGRTSITLAAINIILGVTMMGAVLAQ